MNFGFATPAFMMLRICWRTGYWLTSSAGKAPSATYDGGKETVLAAATDFGS